MIMPSDAERETLLVRILQLLRERLIGSGGAVGGTGRTARGKVAEAVETSRAAVLRHSLRKTRWSPVAGGLLLLLLLLRQLLIGTGNKCQHRQKIVLSSK